MTFSGVYTAIVTPFTRDGKIDEPTLRKLIDRQIESGVTGLVPMGTTGESPTLDHEEHIHVIELVVEQVNGRVPIIAGTGSNSTAEAVEMTKYAAEIGIDASLQVAPYYNRPSQEGMYRHFATIADSVDLPLMIYNIPSRTGQNIENDTMLRLAANTNIQAVKEASGDFKQIMDLIDRKPDTLDIMSGDDNIALPMMSVGGTGVVSVASNMYPELLVAMVKSALSGDFETARKIHYRLVPLYAALFIETNPVPVKYGMSRKGWLEESYRLPLCPMSKQHKSDFDQIIDKIEKV